MSILTSTAIPPGLADATVLDERGQPVRLGETRRARPVVLAFVRHFG